MLRFTALVEVDGKPEPRNWKDREGNEKTSYKLNISQNDGCEVATVGCDDKTYNLVKRHDVVVAHFAFSDGGNVPNAKPYIKLESIEFPERAASSVSSPTSAATASGSSGNTATK